MTQIADDMIGFGLLAQVTCPSIEIPKWHPLGERLTQGTIIEEMDWNPVQHEPPRAPTRDVREWDDLTERLLFVRRLTKAQYAAAVAEYEKAAAEWAKTEGHYHIPGEYRVLGHFSTDSGSLCNGLWDGRKWHWESYSTEVKARSRKDMQHEVPKLRAIHVSESVGQTVPRSHPKPPPAK